MNFINNSLKQENPINAELDLSSKAKMWQMLERWGSGVEQSMEARNLEIKTGKSGCNGIRCQL